MKTALSATFLGVAALVAAGSVFANSPAPQQDSPKTQSTTRFWLHPKLGMVRVAQVTPAMVQPEASTVQKASQAGKQAQMKQFTMAADEKQRWLELYRGR
jgi:hypothetical protein